MFPCLKKELKPHWVQAIFIAELIQVCSKAQSTNEHVLLIELLVGQEPQVLILWCPRLSVPVQDGVPL